MTAAVSHVHCPACGVAVHLDASSLKFRNTAGGRHHCEPVADYGCACDVWIGVLPNGRKIEMLGDRLHRCPVVSNKPVPQNLYELAVEMAGGRRR